MRTTELLETDRVRVWHPYAPMPGTHPPLAVESASGVRLPLAGPRGPELIDGMSSWWAAIHGYRHPALDEAARGQLDRMSHVMFGGLTHEGAVRLCDRLATLTPDGLEHVFLCDSGSVAVEVGIKMCLQYWRSRGQPAKRTLLTWRGGLPRRHVLGDVGVRPRRRHAPAVGRGAAPAGVRRPAAGRLRAPASTPGTPPSSPG